MPCGMPIAMETVRTHADPCGHSGVESEGDAAAMLRSAKWAHTPSDELGVPSELHATMV